MKKRKTAWDRCDEDCFNCKYSDCIKPAYLMRSAYERRASFCGRKDRRNKDLLRESYEKAIDELLMRLV